MNKNKQLHIIFRQHPSICTCDESEIGSGGMRGANALSILLNITEVHNGVLQYEILN